MKKLVWLWLAMLLVQIGLSAINLCLFAVQRSWAQPVFALVMAYWAVVALHEMRISHRMARLSDFADFHLEKMREQAESEDPNAAVFDHHSEQIDACLAEMERLLSLKPWILATAVDS